MKKNKISKTQIHLKQKKIERLRRKSAEKVRQRNIQKNQIKKTFSVSKPKREQLFQPPKRITIKAKQDFSLLDYPENVLSYINHIEDVTSKNKYKIVILDLKEVKIIDIGSVNILLSEINKLKQKQIETICNLPTDVDCKKIFFESGFSDHMRDLQGRKISYSKTNRNLILNRGFDKTSNEQIGLTIKHSVNHLIGIEESFRPLYSIAQEMCANSIEHANEHHKNWLFSVWYKDNDNVCFTMTDIGSGILGTLKRKFSQIIKESLLKDNKEILIRAFEKKYTSITKDINRNKGLPKIKDISYNKYIENLVIITNNVILNFSDYNNSRVLNKNFNGTFYYWELNKNCIEKWKNRKIS